MSRFARYSTPLRERSRILAALREMGYDVQENAPARGFAGQCVQADIVARREGFFDIGLITRPDGNFDVEADWMQTDRTREKFITDVQNEIAAEAAIAGVRKSGGRRIVREVVGDEIVIRAFIPS